MFNCIEKNIPKINHRNVPAPAPVLSPYFPKGHLIQVDALVAPTEVE